ncbi:MAG: glycosyltransferase family 4 protein [Acidobacteriia bacterium]|nr:glycosyltransferase family 4 protein [Terriglobia bacterium]
MKLLVIAQTFPYPLNTGSRNTIFHWIEALSRAHDVRLLFIGDPAEARESIPELPDVKIETMALNPVAPLSARVARLAGAAVRGIPPTSLVAMTRSLRREVLRRVQEGGYDAVVLSENVVAGYAPVLSPLVPVVLLKHSVHAVDARDGRRRLGMWHPRWMIEEWMVKRFERKTCRAAGVVCTVNSEDAAELARRYRLAEPAEVVRIGVDFSRFPRRERDPGGAVIGFFGNMTWGANLDAVRWFADHILPKVWQKLPSAEFRIMGPGSDRVAFDRNDPRIVRCGECDIPNAMKDATIGVVPVISGTGVRFKLLEMLRMGIPTVTTSLGALGTGGIHGEHTLIADDEESFAGAVTLLLSDPALRQKVSRAGAELSEAHAWDRFYPRIRSVVERAASQGRAGRLPAATATERGAP